MATEEKPGVPGERVLKTSDQGVLELTNYRVKFDAAAKGSSKYVSIPLDAVAFCGLTTRSYPWLLAAAGIAGVAAFMQPQVPIRYLLLFVGAALVIAYFITRSGMITVSSNGGEPIEVRASGMSHEQIILFLDAVLEAKLNLLGQLSPETVAAQAAALKTDPDAKGRCPNCEEVIPLSSTSCPKCRANFAAGSAWKVAPV